MGAKRAWLKLYVKSLDSAVWQNKTLWRVWSWALLRANHFPTKTLIDGREVALQPGSFVTGRFSGSVECGLKPSTFWNGILTLKKMGSLDIRPNNKYSVIIVKNWSLYQEKDREATKPLTAKLTAEKNSELTPNGQPVDTVETIEYRKKSTSPSADGLRLAR